MRSRDARRRGRGRGRGMTCDNRRYDHISREHEQGNERQEPANRALQHFSESSLSFPFR